MVVKNAFLHGELDRDIYMEQPKGFKNKENPGCVYKLKKALYGLKQAPRAWYGKIAKFLVQSGYSVAPADSSLFIKAQSEKLTIVSKNTLIWHFLELIRIKIESISMHNCVNFTFVGLNLD